MPDTNLIRSLTYLMDCFLDEYREEKAVKDIDELDLRAQIEVRSKFERLQHFSFKVSYINRLKFIRFLRSVEIFLGFIFLLVYLGTGRCTERKIERTFQRSFSWFS